MRKFVLVGLIAISQWLIFLPGAAFAQPALPELPADTTLEDPNSSSFSSSNIFFDDASLGATDSATADSAATTDTTAGTTTTADSAASTNTATTAATVADSATGADTAIVFWLAAGLAILTLFFIKNIKVKSE